MNHLGMDADAICALRDVLVCQAVGWALGIFLARCVLLIDARRALLDYGADLVADKNPTQPNE